MPWCAAAALYRVRLRRSRPRHGSGLLPPLWGSLSAQGSPRQRSRPPPHHPMWGGANLGRPTVSSMPLAPYRHPSWPVAVTAVPTGARRARPSRRCRPAFADADPMPIADAASLAGCRRQRHKRRRACRRRQDLHGEARRFAVAHHGRTPGHRRPATPRSADAWPELYAANTDIVGPDPSLIHPGLVLTIPQGLNS